MTDGRSIGEVQPRSARAARRPEQRHQLVVDDLENRLRRRQRFEDVCADRPLFDARDERLGRGERDVGLEQRDADFAQRLVDFAFAYLAAAAQAVEDRA